MRKIVLLLSFVVLSLCSFAAGESLNQQAEDEYKAGKYLEAADTYKKILADGQESFALYYNLGNCYYKLGENTQAILNYERALLLDPANKDAQYNLKMAQNQVVDKIEVLPEIFFIRWYKALISWFSADQWAYISVVLFVLFLGMVALFFYSSSVWMKKTGFTLGFVLLFFTVMTIVFSVKLNNRIVERDNAIVVTPSVTVKGAPDASGTSLFVIHEGLKVKVIESLGDWVNIRLEDGNEGWVAKNDVEKI